MTEEETNQMIKLEELFHNKYLNPEFLRQLVGLYVKAIELFSDDYYRAMRSFFMLKMKFVLERPEILKLL
jgi:hypothetical protein